MALKQAFSTTDGVTDLLYVATNINLCCNPIPQDFIPDMTGYTKPEDPGSLDSKFGVDSGYEWEDLYLRWYDKETNTWKDGDGGIVNADAKADVETHLIAINIYNSELSEYNYDYNVQKDVQWRKYMAQKLIDVCA